MPPIRLGLPAKGAYSGEYKQLATTGDDFPLTLLLSGSLRVQSLESSQTA